MNKQKLIAGFFIMGFALLSCNSNSGSSSNDNTYFPKVKAIIATNCISCHNSNNPATWLGRPTQFNDDADIIKNYAAIKASVADPVTATNHRMPQMGSLSPNDIDIIVKWYNKGGKATD